MTLITNIKSLQTWRKTVDLVALIPTMGNLHAGHLKLVEEAQQHTPHAIVSIFVNPLQFGQGEDFSQYPRTLDADIAKLKAAGVTLIFTPDQKMLYPHMTQQYYIEPPAIQHALCGASRPGHFRGVATVVAKLFNLVQPQLAVFGKKDFQQLFIIKNMVADLNFPLTILSVDTGRAEDGLALSSRNQYLSVTERSEAPRLYHHLRAMQAAIYAQERDYLQLAKRAQADLSQRGWQVEYIDIRCRHTLQPASLHDQQLVILIAARLGKTRLIDNIEVDIV